METVAINESKVVEGRRREQIEKDLGEKLDDTILSWRPLGRRIIVVRDEDSSMYSERIYKPEVFKDEMKGEGWILALGPQAGIERSSDAEPSSLKALLDTEGEAAVVGAYVMWGKYVGRVLKHKEGQEDYSGKYLVIHEKDVQAVRRDR